MILKLTALLLIAAALGGCVTPQNIYKRRWAESGCAASGPPQAGRPGCPAGEGIREVFEAALGHPEAS